jgi:hypothetical protein
MYWNGAKNENFILFKDVKDLQDFLQRGDLILKLKESIESAFREYSGPLRDFISEQAKILNKKRTESRIYILKSIQEKLNVTPLNCSSKSHC